MVRVSGGADTRTIRSSQNKGRGKKEKREKGGEEKENCIPYRTIICGDDRRANKKESKSISKHI
jgi:hypothetical protein